MLHSSTVARHQSATGPLGPARRRMNPAVDVETFALSLRLNSIKIKEKVTLRASLFSACQFSCRWEEGGLMGRVQITSGGRMREGGRREMLEGSRSVELNINPW